MATTLKKLCTDNKNPYKLTLRAGANSFRNSITWCHVFEDEYLIRYLHGSELVVTTCVQQQKDPDWLMRMVRQLADHKAGGLIVNTGHFIEDVPQAVLDYCDEKELPLLTMPWEISITDMIRTFCTSIISDEHEMLRHDNALRDALMRRDNVAEYRAILGQHYDLNADFVVMLVYMEASEAFDRVKEKDIEYLFVNRIRYLKTMRELTQTKMGFIKFHNYELLLINKADPEFLLGVRDAVINVYKESAEAGKLFIGLGNRVMGLENISQSYLRAQTAVRMANYRRQVYVPFEDMGFYKILFSIRDEELLYGYSKELLAPLDEYDAKGHNYVELLRAYIQNDRSLEKTAAALYIHRNTVNYQLQKMRELLNSPLKTLEDIFPYQVALAIRDMESKPGK